MRTMQGTLSHPPSFLSPPHLRRREGERVGADGDAAAATSRPRKERRVEDVEPHGAAVRRRRVVQHRVGPAVCRWEGRRHVESPRTPCFPAF